MVQRHVEAKVWAPLTLGLHGAQCEKYSSKSVVLKVGPQTSSVSITWELVRNAYS